VEAVYHILYEGLSPKEAIKKLMSRELRNELEAMKEAW
jgi:glycerol-3-phosphate dehydrogenase